MWMLKQALVASPERWEQQRALPQLLALREVRLQDLGELRPQPHDARGRERLESTELIRTERHRLTLEAHVVHLEARDLTRPPARQEIGSDELVGEGRRIPVMVDAVGARALQ